MPDALDLDLELRLAAFEHLARLRDADGRVSSRNLNAG